jgi:cell division protein FtsL
MGVSSLFFNTTGNNNTAIGLQALNNNTGSGNTAVGVNALLTSTSGTANTAIGMTALNNNTTGGYNTVIGYGAYFENMTGTGITAIGANTSLNGWTNLLNATAIGYTAIVDDHNKVRIGNTEVLSIGGHVGWSTFSDGRFKKQVAEDVKGLEFITLLRPVTYTVDLPGLDNYYAANKTTDEETDVMKQWRQQSYDRAATHRESGFIAQEVEQAAIKAGFTFSGVDKPTNDKALYGLRYADFVVPLVKAVQEQQEMIEKQQEIAEKQQEMIDNQQQKIEELEKAIKNLNH